MNVDFAAVLVIAAVVTGSIWLFDIAVLAPRRARSVTLDKSAVDRRVGRGLSGENLPWYVDFSRSFFPVILIVLVLRSFLVEPFRIPSGSMEPSLLPGDFILVNKFSYGLRLPVINTKVLDLGDPQRGDVVVFRYPEDPAVAYIKRIVGLPGDKLEYRNKRLRVNGELVELLPVVNKARAKPGYDEFMETLGNTNHPIYIRGGGQRSPSGQYTVPLGHFFVLGDNRDNSRDSRYWGTVPEQNLIGKAFFIWMNWDCITGNGNCGRIGNAIE